MHFKSDESFRIILYSHAVNDIAVDHVKCNWDFFFNVVEIEKKINYTIQ